MGNILTTAASSIDGNLTSHAPEQGKAGQRGPLCLFWGKVHTISAPVFEAVAACSLVGALVLFDQVQRHLGKA